MTQMQRVAVSFQEEFEPDIHWDGKLIEDIIGYRNLPILVSGQDVDQFLTVSKASQGTGRRVVWKPA